MIAVSFLLLLSLWSGGNRCTCSAFSLSPTNSKRTIISTSTSTSTSTNTIENQNRVPRRTSPTASLSSLFGSAADGDDSTTSSTVSASSKEAHALEVFLLHASEGEYEGQKFVSDKFSLLGVLESLGLEATLEDADIVFRFLDTDGDGLVVFDEEFLPWYMDAVADATEISRVFQSLLVGRRTVAEFDKTIVDDDILKRAVECAVAAPNRSCNEPWRFLSVGPKTVEKLAVLDKDRTKADAEQGKFTRFMDWTTVAPGWCVVTMQLPEDTYTESDDVEVEIVNDETIMSSILQEDFKSVSCAIQNFMLSMWSEGIGTKWTTGPVQKTPEFADICGIDRSKERVVGIIWYGYATGGTKYADPRRRKLSVDDVLGYLP